MEKGASREIDARERGWDCASHAGRVHITRRGSSMLGSGNESSISKVNDSVGMALGRGFVGRDDEGPAPVVEVGEEAPGTQWMFD